VVFTPQACPVSKDPGAALGRLNEVNVASQMAAIRCFARHVGGGSDDVWMEMSAACRPRTCNDLKHKQTPSHRGPARLNPYQYLPIAAPISSGLTLYLPGG
jgi:hypothetical protein